MPTNQLKRLSALLPLLFFSIISFSQISFEKGYYIQNNGTKSIGYIKNIDWKNNPTEFEFRISEKANSQILTIENIKEFGIDGISKYVRQNVDIDRSTDELDKLTSHREPDFNNEQLFLKVLVSGKATLFFYEKGNQRKYFFDDKDGIVKPLIYKRYRDYGVSDKNFKVNSTYKQQLYNYLECESIKQWEFEKLQYSKDDLVNIFVKYNKCQNGDFTNYKAKEKRKIFNLNVRPGIRHSSLLLQNSVAILYQLDYGSKTNIRLGAEAEFIMPFNKDKWAVFVEPTFQYFKATEVSELLAYSSDVNYKSIELPVGIRHYFFLNENNQIFINASLVFDLPINSTITFEPGPILDVNTSHNYAVGAGFKHNNRLSLEFRHQTFRTITKRYLYWPSKYQTISMVLGYNLLK